MFRTVCEFAVLFAFGTLKQSWLIAIEKEAGKTKWPVAYFPKKKKAPYGREMSTHCFLKAEGIGQREVQLFWGSSVLKLDI